MTTLVPQLDDKEDKRDLASILRSLTDQKSTPNVPEIRSKDTEVVQVREGALEALQALSELLRTVELPSEFRSLDREELVRATNLAVQAKLAATAATNAVAAVKEAFFNHLDLTLEEIEDAEPGEAPHLVDPETGHYLVAQEVFVEELNKRLCRELSEKAPVVTAKDLRSLWQSGKISRDDYMSATKHVEVPREVVDEQLADLLKRKPQLLSVIAGAITPGTVTASFHVRDPKKESKKR